MFQARYFLRYLFARPESGVRQEWLPGESARHLSPRGGALPAEVHGALRYTGVAAGARLCVLLRSDGAACVLGRPGDVGLDPRNPLSFGHH